MPGLGQAVGGPVARGVVTYVPATPRTVFVISGITKNSAGAILADCAVTLYETGVDLEVASTTSDSTGSYIFNVGLSAGRTFYIVAYKAGAPDVAGTTVNTLVAV